MLDYRAYGSGNDPGSWQSACMWRESQTRRYAAITFHQARSYPHNP